MRRHTITTSIHSLWVKVNEWRENINTAVGLESRATLSFKHLGYFWLHCVILSCIKSSMETASFFFFFFKGLTTLVIMIQRVLQRMKLTCVIYTCTYLAKTYKKQKHTSQLLSDKKIEIKNFVLNKGNENFQNITFLLKIYQLSLS